MTPAPFKVHTLAQCRLLDTRNADRTNGGPALSPGVERVFADGAARDPGRRQGSLANVAATGALANGNPRLYPAECAVPTTSSINSAAGLTRANNAIIGLDASGEVAEVCWQASSTAHLVVYVNGSLK